MKKSITSVLSILCILAISTTVSAQKGITKAARKIIKKEMEDFQEFMDDPKLDKKIITSYGVGSGPLPSKVGLLSFYVADDDYSTYSDFYRTDHKATEEKVNATVQLIYNKSIEAIKEQYALLGMELQTPNEFLTSEDLKQTYYNQPLSRTESKAAIFDVAGSGAGVPDDIRLVPFITYSGGTKVMKEQWGYLDALGLDAYVIVEIGLIAANGSIKNIKSRFFYKNPNWKEGDNPAVGHIPYGAGNCEINLAPPMKGLYIKEEQEYKNKRGKTDTKFVKVDINSNASLLVEQVVSKLGKTSASQILAQPKKKKKKKKKK